MLPFGHWFNPTDEQLSQTLEEIDHGRLTPYRLSTERFIEYVKDTDHTNGFRPWNLNWDPKEGMYDNVRYCCIRRQKFSEKAKKKTCRKSGSGNLSWKNTGNCDAVCGGKAQKLKLILMEKEITWIMHEYTLKAKSTDFQKWAICRIEKKKINKNKDKEKGTTSWIRKKGKGKAAWTKEVAKESGVNFNDEQNVDNDPTKNIVELESLDLIEMKNSSYVGLLQENLRETGTSNEGTEESSRRYIQHVQEYLDKPSQDDPRFNIEDSSIYRKLEQIVQNVDNHTTKNIVDELESVNMIEMKNSSDVEQLQENLRESGTSNEGTEESGIRDIQRLRDCLEQPIQDDPRINIQDHTYHKELEQILRVQNCQNLDDDPPTNILDDNEAFNELLSSIGQDPQAL